MKNASFKRIVEEAWQKRAAVRARTDAFRILNGAASGTPGLIADMFAGYLTIYAYVSDLRERYGDFPELLAEVAAAKVAVLKDRVSNREEEREASRDLLGSVPETVEVREGKLKFLVHPKHPRNVGLFLDTRPLRASLSESCPRHDVLNLFAYTCSLGVAAAWRNQGSVVNVDISQRYLAMGRENFRLNELPEDRCLCKRMDSETYLDWAARKSLDYDVVILDPPSFSRFEGKTFSFAADYARLLGKCTRLVRPGGRLFALTNYSQISPSDFRELAKDAAREGGRGFSDLRSLELPVDFDPSPESGESDWRPGGEGTLLALEAEVI